MALSVLNLEATDMDDIIDELVGEPELNDLDNHTNNQQTDSNPDSNPNDTSSDTTSANPPEIAQDDTKQETQPQPSPTERKATQREIAAREVTDKIKDLMPCIHRAKYAYEQSKEETKCCKKSLEVLQEQLVSLGNELVDVESGVWQERLPFSGIPDDQGGGRKSQPEGIGDGGYGDDGEGDEGEDDETTSNGPSEDLGAMQPISALGMTSKETEALEAADIDTVGDLEERMRADAWWFKKIKGYGDSKVEKLQEKHLAYRLQYPMPTND